MVIVTFLKHVSNVKNGCFALFLVRCRKRKGRRDVCRRTENVPRGCLSWGRRFYFSSQVVFASYSNVISYYLLLFLSLSLSLSLSSRNFEFISFRKVHAASLIGRFSHSLFCLLLLFIYLFIFDYNYLISIFVRNFYFIFVNY